MLSLSDVIGPRFGLFLSLSNTDFIAYLLYLLFRLGPALELNSRQMMVCPMYLDKHCTFPAEIVMEYF